jgi:hypothetical protein
VEIFWLDFFRDAHSSTQSIALSSTAHITVAQNVQKCRIAYQKFHEIRAQREIFQCTNFKLEISNVPAALGHMWGQPPRLSVERNARQFFPHQSYIFQCAPYRIEITFLFAVIPS